VVTVAVAEMRGGVRVRELRRSLRDERRVELRREGLGEARVGGLKRRLMRRLMRRSSDRSFGLVRR
jgi:hypothetical protein